MKVPPVVQYRRFRNTDPPRLVTVWNEALTGRGAVQLRTSSPLERHVFAKPYFDPEGLILAEEGGKCVGFAHAGFGPDESGSALSTATGVTCLVAVRPAYRRRGLGSELLRRCEAYLRSRGAVRLVAGPQDPFSPFYLGLYGGSDLPGFLESDPLAAAFLERHGYRPARRVLALQRKLSQPLKVLDTRFVNHRPRFELREDPRTHLGSWWRDCVFGMVEPLEFYLLDRPSGARVARALVWEMEGFSCLWNQPSVGITGVEVLPEFRRRGVGKFLVAQILKRIQEQYYEVAEAQAPEDDAAAAGLFRSLGFTQVDAGRLYERQEV
jgi:ribosomal protein S18 acetylase RimI-like enzyme